MSDFFKDIKPLSYDPEGSDLTFRHYNPDEVVMGKRMEDHLRFALAYWHSFAWPGGDPFGGQTFDRPWFGETMDMARLKADVAFEMFDLLNAPFFCWHDADIRPEGDTFAESLRNFEEIIDYFGTKMESSKTKLLWGTAARPPTPTRRSLPGPRRRSKPVWMRPTSWTAGTMCFGAGARAMKPC